MDRKPNKIYVFIPVERITFEIGQRPRIFSGEFGERPSSVLAPVKSIRVYDALREIHVDFEDDSSIEYHNVGYTFGLQKPEPPKL